MKLDELIARRTVRTKQCWIWKRLKKRNSTGSKQATKKLPSRLEAS